jgi:hypothetical protein
MGYRRLVVCILLYIAMQQSHVSYEEGSERLSSGGPATEGFGIEWYQVIKYANVASMEYNIYIYIYVNVA